MAAAAGWGEIAQVEDMAEIVASQYMARADVRDSRAGPEMQLLDSRFAAG